MPTTRGRGIVEPAPEQDSSSPRVVRASAVQAAGGEQNRGVDPGLLAALKETVTAAVSTSVQAETTLLAAHVAGRRTEFKK